MGMLPHQMDRMDMVYITIHQQNGRGINHKRLAEGHGTTGSLAKSHGVLAHQQIVASLQTGRRSWYHCRMARRHGIIAIWQQVIESLQTGRKSWYHYSLAERPRSFSVGQAQEPFYPSKLADCSWHPSRLEERSQFHNRLEEQTRSHGRLREHRQSHHRMVPARFQIHRIVGPHSRLFARMATGSLQTCRWSRLSAQLPISRAIRRRTEEDDRNITTIIID